MEESALSNLSEEQEALVWLIIIFTAFENEISPIIDKIGEKYKSHI